MADTERLKEKPSVFPTLGNETAETMQELLDALDAELPAFLS